MTHETMYFRDYLACGHSMRVEVLVRIDPQWRCQRDVGSFSFCVTCPPRAHGAGPALSEIVRTDARPEPGRGGRRRRHVASRRAGVV